MQYIIEQCNLVRNPNYSFYLVSIDAKNQFNTFLEQAQKNKQDLKSIHKIIALMDYINPYSKLPKEKFRHIEDNNSKARNDIYEFKDKSIRIYVIFQPPSFYIIRGGYKKDQLKDIERVKRDTKDFPYFNFS